MIMTWMGKWGKSHARSFCSVLTVVVLLLTLFFFSPPTFHSNGHIEVEELVQMMSELKRATGVTSAEDEAKTEADAECVLKILDADGNGTLEAEEFVKWVQTGLKRPQEDRNEVASMSQINRRMDNFLTSVSIVADELEITQNGDGE